MAKITLEKIAEDLGISKVAVSKALNNQKGVSDALRMKIVQHAESLGYNKRTSVSDTRNKRFLYMINQDFFLTPSEQFYSTIFYFLTSICLKAQCQLQIAFLEPDYMIDKMKASIASYKPDGIFFAGEVRKSIIRYIEKMTIPCVFIDYFNPLYNCNYVYVDNYSLGFQLTKYLVAQGHKKIGFVGDIQQTASIADRFFGYQRALQDERLPFKLEWHVNENLEKKSQPLVISDKLSDMPTAYLSHCDAAAQRLYTSLSIKGYRVPDDISVISFDNTDLCDSLVPKLTSAGPSKEVFARKAFQVMNDCIGSKNKTFHVVVRTQLVERSSVKNILDSV
ncbi:MAG: LacI family DNA-binding transcriptional regulator [Candidatus Izemoplasmatales bacterium]|nr:LacI family DNA-binding transcriptional regulator [bacterium]MDZ4197563.1 LacI family DNA-binding transcriptional regulator [Candidatus Izemoplasmatales bacterium]